MSASPIDLEDKRGSRPGPFRVRSIRELAPARPKRDWLIESILLRRSVTLLSGDGGMGKSLLCLQLQVASAIGGADFLGITLPAEPINSFGLYCEDDDEEIHRRLFDICKFYHVEFRQLEDRVRWASRVGEENELVTFRRPRYGTPDSAVSDSTPLLKQLEQEIRDMEHQLIIIDTAADTYGGNENIRSQVRAFCNRLRRLAMVANGGVMLNAHPSKSAIADGSGFSGSTAWNGSVRNRLYLTKPKPPPEDLANEDHPTDDRVLRVMKSNYGPFGQRIKCKYVAGAFEAIEQPNMVRSVPEKLELASKLLALAAELVSGGTYISADASSKTWLVPQAQRAEQTRGLPYEALRAAYKHLVENKSLVRVHAKRDSKWRDCVRPAHLRYPEEKEQAQGLIQFAGGSAG